MIHKLQTLDVNSYVYFEAVKGWKKNAFVIRRSRRTAKLTRELRIDCLFLLK